MAFNAQIIGATLHTNRATNTAAVVVIHPVSFASMQFGRQR